MTDIEIIIAVAKLNPEVTEQDYDSIFRDWRKGNTKDDPNFMRRVADHLICNNKNYTESYDAIIPVIEKQDATTKAHLIYGIHHQVNIVDENEPWHTDDIVSILLATPRRLCIALLKATNNWKE